MKRAVLSVLFVLFTAPVFAQEQLTPLSAVLLTEDATVRPPAAPAWTGTLKVQKRNRALPWNWFRGASSAIVLQANVQNPTTFEFTPSPDHNTSENGVALVTRYDLEVYNAANAVATTINAGKPTPVNNLITNTSLLRPATVGLPAGTYTAKVAAVGPGGTARSASSNPFDLTPRSPTASGTPVIR